MSLGIGSAGRARTLRTYGRTRDGAVEVVTTEIEGVLGTGGTADATVVDGEVVNGTATTGTAAGAGGPGTAVKEATISNGPSSRIVRFTPTDDLAWAPVATSPYH